MPRFDNILPFAMVICVEGHNISAIDVRIEVILGTGAQRVVIFVVVLMSTVVVVVMMNHC